MVALSEEKLVDIFMLDWDIVVLTNWCRIMPELEPVGVKASSHIGWIRRPYYVAQLAAGVGNVIMFEGIPGRTEGVDYSAYKLLARQIIVLY